MALQLFLKSSKSVSVSLNMLFCSFAKSVLLIFFPLECRVQYSKTILLYFQIVRGNFYVKKNVITERQQRHLESLTLTLLRFLKVHETLKWGGGREGQDFHRISDFFFFLDSLQNDFQFIWFPKQQSFPSLPSFAGQKSGKTRYYFLHYYILHFNDHLIILVEIIQKIELLRQNGFDSANLGQKNYQIPSF